MSKKILFDKVSLEELRKYALPLVGKPCSRSEAQFLSFEDAHRTASQRGAQLPSWLDVLVARELYNTQLGDEELEKRAQVGKEHERLGDLVIKAINAGELKKSDEIMHQIEELRANAKLKPRFYDLYLPCWTREGHECSEGQHKFGLAVPTDGAVALKREIELPMKTKGAFNGFSIIGFEQRGGINVPIFSKKVPRKIKLGCNIYNRSLTGDKWVYERAAPFLFGQHTSASRDDCLEMGCKDYSGRVFVVKK